VAEPPLLGCRELQVEIAGRSVCAALDLEIHPGSSWALLGRNGVGKTTLLHTLAGLRPATGGTRCVDGVRLEQIPRRRLATRIGLPQDNRDLFPASVLETALIGRHPHLRGLAWEGPGDLALARDALAAVGLAGFEARTVTTLSGGERRRLAMATLLLQQPAVALLDEPANHLDLRHQVELLGLLRRTQAERGGALLMVLHDVNLATRFCDHALLLFGDGETLAGPLGAVLDAASLERLYGLPLVAVDGPLGTAWLPGPTTARRGGTPAAG
jgi:iron complex transport system ATP-binding protein